MKLTNLTIKNMIGIKQAEINNPRPVVFIAGPNGAGKSSLQNIVASALTEQLTRVGLKKDAGALVHEGSEEGAAAVEFDHGSYLLNISKGKFARVCNVKETPDVIAYLLDPRKFASDTSADRRRLLLKLSGVKASREVIASKMAARGINAGYIDSIAPFLVSGFEDALKEAQGYAREAKAAWRTVAGETYGEKKAETWKAKADGNLEEIQNQVMDKEMELAAIDAELEQANQAYGAMKAAKDKAATLNADIARLRGQADRLGRVKVKLEIDQRELNHWRQVVEQAKMASHGVGPDDTPCFCPDCGCELVFVAKDKKLVSRGGDLHGDEETAVKLPEYERTLEMFMNSVKNGERDLAAAEMAKAQLSTLEARCEDAPPGGELARVTEKIEQLKGDKKKLNAEINELIEKEKALRQADEITASAYKHHAQVIEWEKVISALSPDGIPHELLIDALKPFRMRLPESAYTAGWGAPVIDDDMEISYLGRPYALLSESEQWRVDCLITEAISYLSKVRFFALDRMDVLDGVGRMCLIEFLDQLAHVGHIDTVLLTGTLKKEQALGIQQAMDHFSVYWAEDGHLAPLEVNQKAVA